jgi:hypothetical protein
MTKQVVLKNKNPVTRFFESSISECTRIGHAHDLVGTLGLRYGPHALGHHDEHGGLTLTRSWQPAKSWKKTCGGKVQKTTFPPCLEIPQSTRDSNFPTASAAAGD